MNNNDTMVEKLKSFILDIEANASKEILSSKGFTEMQAMGSVDSAAVSTILKAIDLLCEENQ